MYGINIFRKISTIEDIIKAKNDGQKIYATIIEEIPRNNPDEPLIIKDIDECKNINSKKCIKKKKLILWAVVYQY